MLTSELTRLALLTGFPPHALRQCTPAELAWLSWHTSETYRKAGQRERESEAE